MTAMLIYSPKYPTFSYGPSHPLRPERLYLTYMLMDSYGLLTGPGLTVVEPEPASLEDCLRVHSQDYLTALKRGNNGEIFPEALNYGLGYGDNPVFEGIYDWSLLVCGGTLRAVQEVAVGSAPVAFHFGGGLHHAFRNSAAGFCYLNDAAMAIAEQVEKGLRVLYLDVDAHHGDGVQEAFYNTDRVLTISIHETGNHLFPGTGYVEEMGEGKGNGYSVNVPLYPGSADQVFKEAFEAVVSPLLVSFGPDLLVVQLGVDTMESDPLAHLKYTSASLEHTLRRIRELFSGPLAVLGGGGYDMDTVARAWTLAWSILIGRDVPDPLPDAYIQERGKYGTSIDRPYTLRDPIPDLPPDQTVQLEHLDEVLVYFRDRGIIS
jgi:acetoin utilization protein AcuC